MRGVGIIFLAMATGGLVGYLTRWLNPDCRLYYHAAVMAFAIFCYAQGAFIEATIAKEDGEKRGGKE